MIAFLCVSASAFTRYGRQEGGSYVGNHPGSR
jgi:hypothetical protein